MREAIQQAESWSDVAARLEISEKQAASLPGHAARLEIATSHLVDSPAQNRDQRGVRPSLSNLDRAGSLIAASWYTLSGYEVSWPLELARYDLVVFNEAGARRIQVKTTTTKAGDSWKVYISMSGSVRRTYGPEEIDDFFVIDGDFQLYVIPIAKVGGLQAIHLNRYQEFIVPSILS